MPLIHTRFQPGGEANRHPTSEPFQRFSILAAGKPLKRLRQIDANATATRLKPGENESADSFLDALAETSLSTYFFTAL
jgi:hypothetical protein